MKGRGIVIAKIAMLATIKLAASMDKLALAVRYDTCFGFWLVAAVKPNRHCLS